MRPSDPGAGHGHGHWPYGHGEGPNGEGPNGDDPNGDDPNGDAGVPGADLVLDEAFWEGMYRSRSTVWSGRPNPQLVTEVSALVPGTALDVGSGEGADAVWLAERGWQVTAVDISATALMIGESTAAQAGPEVSGRITWRQADMISGPALADATYDLVTAHFMQIPSAQREALHRRLAEAVSPAGTLLVVGHHPSDVHAGVGRSPMADLMFTASTPGAGSDSGDQPTRAPEHNAYMARPFQQVDVFTSTPYLGNPVAVVLDADGLTTEQMQVFARWTNLSETTFVFPPIDQSADYRVRIFTPLAELPFAGHPTLGTCHAWLAAGQNAAAGAQSDSDAETREIVQECAAGLVRIRRTSEGLAFAAPPLLREGPVEAGLLDRIPAMLGISRADIVDAQWADNGPGWVAILLGSAEAVLALRPNRVDLDLGVVGPYPPGSPQAFEVRAFFPKDGGTTEDPVTGSLNASLASWLLRTGRATAPYVVSQGTALGRAGRVHVSCDSDATLWVGGGTVTCISGQLDL